MGDHAAYLGRQSFRYMLALIWRVKATRNRSVGLRKRDVSPKKAANGGLSDQILRPE